MANNFSSRNLHKSAYISPWLERCSNRIRIELLFCTVMVVAVVSVKLDKRPGIGETTLRHFRPSVHMEPRDTFALPDSRRQVHDKPGSTVVTLALPDIRFDASMTTEARITFK